MVQSKAAAPSIPWSMGLSITIVTLAVVYMSWQPSQILQWLNPQSLPATIEQLGVGGPLIYIVIITLSVVISQIPGAPLAVAAGTIWHPLWAGIYTVIGGFSGALIAYGLGKTIGPAIVKSLTGKTIHLSVDRHYLGWMIFVTRLLPIFSFDLISYGAGIARLPLPVYASATLFGMVPSTLLLTYLGDSLQPSSWAITSMMAIFLTLFIGIPALLYQYNGLNLREFISWEDKDC
ncbi:MAG: TVP38/TMEM64 family protein [Leptolyngbyaceae cyanobacterium]